MGHAPRHSTHQDTLAQSSVQLHLSPQGDMDRKHSRLALQLQTICQCTPSTERPGTPDAPASAFSCLAKRPLCTEPQGPLAGTNFSFGPAATATLRTEPQDCPSSHPLQVQRTRLPRLLPRVLPSSHSASLRQFSAQWGCLLQHSTPCSSPRLCYREPASHFHRLAFHILGD